MASHTPGPWEAYLRNRTSNPPYIMRVGDTSGWIAQTCTWMGADEAEANARLIAAAPALLDALRGMVDMYVDLVNSGDAGFWDPEKVDEVKHARAALALTSHERNGSEP